MEAKVIVRDITLLLGHREVVFGIVFALVAGVAGVAAIVQALRGFPSGALEVIVLAAAAAVFATFSRMMLRKGLPVYGRERRLRKIGTAAEGVVVAVAQGDLIVNNMPQWVIRYTFVDHRGRPYEGVSREMSAEEAHRWQAGDRGRVLFDRQNPSDHAWVGGDE